MDVTLDRKTQQARCACGKQGLYNSIFSHCVRSKDPRCREPLTLLGVSGGTAPAATPEPSPVSGEQSEAVKPSAEEPTPAEPVRTAVPKPDNGAGLEGTPGPTYFKFTMYVPVELFAAFDVYRNRLMDLGMPNFEGDFGEWLCQMALDDLVRIGFTLDASIKQAVEA